MLYNGTDREKRLLPPGKEKTTVVEHEMTLLRCTHLCPAFALDCLGIGLSDVCKRCRYHLRVIAGFSDMFIPNGVCACVVSFAVCCNST